MSTPIRCTRLRAVAAVSRAVASDCPATAASGPASGPVSGFDGLENVIQEGRSLISHSAYTSRSRGGVLPLSQAAR